jgi:NADH dehydrogenase FAD-containing subunit
MLQGLAIRLELARRGVAVMLSTRAADITGDGVATQGGGGSGSVEADTVVYAVGQSPLRGEADALRALAPEFHQIGDCLTPRNIPEATRAAYYIARDIGRV